jgi:hypothetical protein
LSFYLWPLGELLRWMPFPLHDVYREFRLEKQPHAQGFLFLGDAEGFPGIDPRVEVQTSI